MQLTMKPILLILTAATLLSGVRYNSIYLGNDVASEKGTQDIAVQISSDGTVTVWIGAKVPELHDPWGKDVILRRVVTNKRR
jgi:hypothetical protein